MDTKSKKSNRYPVAVKALCVVLSALCVLGMYASVLYVVLAMETMSVDEMAHPLTAASGSFYDSNLFWDNLNADISAVSDLITCPQRQAMLSQLGKQRDDVVEAQTQQYLQKKAAIIRGEIYYVATHYDEDADYDYDYDAYMRDFSTTATTVPQPAEEEITVPVTRDAASPVTEPVTAAPETTTQPAQDDTLSALPTVPLDERAPYNVRYCQKLVNTVTGLDWLQYASLVRQDAFTERYFAPDFGALGNDGVRFDYQQSEADIRSFIGEAFDNALHRQQSDCAEALEQAADRLDGAVNLKYRAVSPDGTVYTNTDDAERGGQTRYILCKDGKAETSPDANDVWKYKAKAVQMYAQDIYGEPFELSVYVLDPLQSGDRYADAMQRFEQVRRFSPGAVLTFWIVSALTLLACCIALLCMCGRKAGADGVTLSFIDRVPTDVHLAVCVAGGAVLAYLLYAVYDSVNMQMLTDASTAFVWIAVLALMPAILCAMWLLSLEWLLSTVRIKKAGQSFFRRFFLWKALRYLWKGVCFVCRYARKAVLYVLEKPKRIRYVFLLVTLLYAAVSTFWIFVVSGVANEEGIAVFGFLLLSAVYALFQIRYLRTLDTIIDRSCDRTQLPIEGTETMPPALRTLAENLSVTSSELDKAVAQAVRDARTKAELITNVSHDLKTPLTSVISYVDLLKGCDITDETARGYIDILDEKSANLKRLIEDLIEASKVSAGNVTLHPVPLNLAELAMQAVVEATPELEERGLDVRFADTQDAPIVLADGAKTHRILENLLSNVRKYAADGSRVYIRVGEESGYGVFEIKNVSAEPLDMDPQELMERFVRGDKSRTKEGNGLGLSIAQQLCTLQGGRLDIRIDGDLFKASVFLPKHTQQEGKAVEA